MKAAQKLARKDKKEGKGNDSKSGDGHPPGGKFPQKPAKGQPNKCTVDGKEYYFHFKSLRWLPVDQQANVASLTLVAGTAATVQHPTIRNGTNAERNLAFSIFPTSSKMPFLLSKHLWQMELTPTGAVLDYERSQRVYGECIGMCRFRPL
jgi:hypothetical protein